MVQRTAGARGAEPAHPRPGAGRPDHHRHPGHARRGRQGPPRPPHADPAGPAHRPPLRDHPERADAAQRGGRQRGRGPGPAAVQHLHRRCRGRRLAARPRQGGEHRTAAPDRQPDGRRALRPHPSGGDPEHDHRRPRPPDVPERHRPLQLPRRAQGRLRGPPAPARLAPPAVGGAARHGRVRQHGRRTAAVQPRQRARGPRRAGRTRRARFRAPRPHGRARRHDVHGRARPRGARPAAALRRRGRPTARRHPAVAQDDPGEPVARRAAAQRSARGARRRGRTAAPGAHAGDRGPGLRRLVAHQRPRHPGAHRAAPRGGQPRRGRATRPVPRPVRHPDHRSPRRRTL